MKLHELSEIIKKEFKQYTGDQDLIRFYYWMAREYKLHATLPKDLVKITLDRMIVAHPEYKFHLDILKKYFNEEESIETYFSVAVQLVRSVPVQNNIIPLQYYTEIPKKNANEL